jgi:hypothetical protein
MANHLDRIIMIIENILPKTYQHKISELLLDDYFPWYWCENVNQYSKNVFQFTHNFVKDYEVTSQHLSLIEPILYFFEKETGMQIVSLFRVKANLLPKQKISASDVKSLIHQDVDMAGDGFLSLIYYLDDYKEPTVFYDKNFKVKNEIKPKKNSLIWFASSEIHSACPPSTDKRRVVINFVVHVNNKKEKM